MTRRRRFGGAGIRRRLRSPVISSAAAWTPAQLAADVSLVPEINLTESGGDVSEWADAYGGAAVFQQTNASLRPTIATSAAFNDQLVISSNGVDQFLEQTLAVAKWPGGAVDMVFVAQLLGDGRGQLYCDRAAGDGMQFEKDTSNQVVFRLLGDGSVSNRAVPRTAFNVTLEPDPVAILCRWNGVDTLSMTVDGVTVTTGATAAQVGDPVDSAAVEPRLFARGDGSQFGAWAVGEHFIKWTDGGFAANQLDDLRAHWLTKYGTTL